ncbi:MAG: cupin domain-containing protein [Sideroxydans sp.]|nr:cupin domain-containing protein [Sideroxydans sp.]
MTTNKLFALLLTGGALITGNAFAAAGAAVEQTFSTAEMRPSLTINKSPLKQYFSGGEVRLDPVYPASDAKTHSGAYVTFEPGARTNWHTHPAGQHIIVISGVGYTQTWQGERRTIKAGDVVWCPIGVKHWHGATEQHAMTHLVITGVDDQGKNVEWLEPVTDKQYTGK